MEQAGRGKKEASEALMSKNMFSNIGQIPLFNGNFHTP